MMRIAAEAVSVEIGGKPLLDSVNLEVRPGELTGLIGPNGAGKTTLLRLLGALRPPGSGRVLYDGEAIARRERPALARRLAYLAQGGEAHWPLRVERLVALGRLPHQGPLGRTSAEDQAAVERALQRSGVEHLRARTLTTLSGGERMQVLLARALAVEAEALLADEPVAALDPHHQLRVMDLLRAEARAGKAVVVVLHDLSLAARFCDRLALLHRGRLLAQGRPETVLGDRELASAYGVRVLRGVEKGEPFLLPWERLEGGERP